MSGPDRQARIVPVSRARAPGPEGWVFNSELVEKVVDLAFDLVADPASSRSRSAGSSSCQSSYREVPHGPAVGHADGIDDRQPGDDFVTDVRHVHDLDVCCAHARIIPVRQSNAKLATAPTAECEIRHFECEPTSPLAPAVHRRPWECSAPARS